jgi:uncharacterized protein YggE
MAKEIKIPTISGAISRTVIWLGVVAGVVVISMFAIHTAKNFVPDILEHERDSKPSMVATSGECLTGAKKDRTAITLRVRALDKNSATSMKTASAKMAEITTYLKNTGAEIQTTDFSSYEKTEWDQENQKSVSLGIETSLAVEASSENMATIESILEKFAGDENVYTENLRMFTSAKTMQTAIEECLDGAVKNARARAESIAAADGKTVGKLISATYGNTAPSPIMPANFLRGAKMEVAMDAAYAGGGLVAKDTEVSVAVNAVFEVK